jgi:hypothetical protein
MLLLTHSMQWPDELEFFSEVHKAVEGCYVDGKLKWMSRPDDSAFCILSKDEMEAKSEKAIQDILKDHRIYVIDHSQPLPQFDEHALATLG